MQPLYVWVFFYDAWVCTTLFSQMTNYEYAPLGTVYEFLLVTREIVHSQVILHDCSNSQIMQTTELFTKRDTEIGFFFIQCLF